MSLVAATNAKPVSLAIFSEAGRFIGHCHDVDPVATTVAQLRRMIAPLVPYKYTFRGCGPAAGSNSSSPNAAAEAAAHKESFMKVYRLLPRLTIRGAPVLGPLLARGCAVVDLPAGLAMPQRRKASKKKEDGAAASAAAEAQQAADKKDESNAPIRVLNVVVLVAENPGGDPVLLERVRLGAEAPGRRIPANRFDGLDPHVAIAEDVASGGQSLLHELAASGSNVALERFITYQMQSLVQQQQGDAPAALFVAALNRPDAAGRTPLWHAASRGLVNTVHVLLRAGADPLAAGCGAALTLPASNGSSDDRASPSSAPSALEAAIEGRHDAVVDTICAFIRDNVLPAGGDESAFPIAQSVCDRFVESAPSLHQLAFEGDVEAVQFLTSHLLYRPYMALLTARDAATTGGTALHAAARGGSVDMVQHLVDRCGLHPDEPDLLYGNTPLFYAARHGHAAVVHALVILGASVTRLNKLHQSPLHVALSSSSPHAAHRFLHGAAEEGADGGGGGGGAAAAALVTPGARFAVLEELFRGLEAQPDGQSKIARVCDAVTDDSLAAICAARGDVASLQRVLRVCGRSACTWSRPQRAPLGSLPWTGGGIDGNGGRIPVKIAAKRKRNFGAFYSPRGNAAPPPRTPLMAALDGIGPGSNNGGASDHAAAAGTASAARGKLARSKLECALLIAEGYVAGDLKADELPETAAEINRCIAAALCQTGSNVNIGFSVAKALLTVSGARMAAEAGEQLLRLLVPTRFVASVQWLCECKVASDPVSWKRALLDAAANGGTPENLKAMLATTHTISALPGWLEGQDGDELCAAAVSLPSAISVRKNSLALLDVLLQAGAVPARRALAAAAKRCDPDVFRKILTNLGGSAAAAAVATAAGVSTTSSSSGAVDDNKGPAAMLDPDTVIATVKQLLAPLRDPTFKVRRRRLHRAAAALCMSSLLAAVGAGGARTLLWDANFADVFAQAVLVAAGSGGTACEAVGKTTPHTPVVFPDLPSQSRRQQLAASSSSSAAVVAVPRASTLANGGGPQMVAAFVELLLSVQDRSARSECVARLEPATVARALTALSFLDDVRPAVRLLECVADAGVDVAATRTLFARWLVHGSGFAVLAGIAAGSTQRWKACFDGGLHRDWSRRAGSSAVSAASNNLDADGKRQPAEWHNGLDLRPLLLFKHSAHALRMQSAFASPFVRRIVRALIRMSSSSASNTAATASTSSTSHQPTGMLREASFKNLVGSAAGDSTAAGNTLRRADDAAVVVEWFLRFAVAQRKQELEVAAAALRATGRETPCASDTLVLGILCDAARMGAVRVTQLCAQWLLQLEQRHVLDSRGEDTVKKSTLRSAAFQQAILDAAAEAVCCTTALTSGAGDRQTAVTTVSRQRGSTVSTLSRNSADAAAAATTAGAVPSASSAAFVAIVAALLPLIHDVEHSVAQLPGHIASSTSSRAPLLAVACVWGSAAAVSEVCTAVLSSSSSSVGQQPQKSADADGRQRADAVLGGIKSLGGDATRRRLLDIARNLAFVQATASTTASRTLAETAALPRLLPLAARLRRWDDVCELVLSSCSPQFLAACAGTNDAANDGRPQRWQTLSAVISDSEKGENRRQLVRRAWCDVLDCAVAQPDGVRQLARFAGVVAHVVRRVPVTTAAQAAFVYALAAAAPSPKAADRIAPVPRTEEARRVVACRHFALQLANPMTRARKEALLRAQRMARAGYDDDDENDGAVAERDAGHTALGEDGGVNVFASACRAGMVDVARAFARLAAEYDVVRRYCLGQAGQPQQAMSAEIHPHSNALFCALRSGSTSIVYDAFDGTWPIELTRALLPSLDTPTGGVTAADLLREAAGGDDAPAAASASAVSAVPAITPADAAFGLLRSGFGVLPQLRHFPIAWGGTGGPDEHQANIVALLKGTESKRTGAAAEQADGAEEEDEWSTPARRRAAAGGVQLLTTPLRVRISNKVMLASDSPVDTAAAVADWTTLSELLAIPSIAAASGATARAVVYGARGGAPVRFGSTLLLALFLLPRGNKAHRTRMERNVSVLWTQQQQHQQRRTGAGGAAGRRGAGKKANNGGASNELELARFEWILCLSLAVYHGLFDTAIQMLDAATRDGTQLPIRMQPATTAATAAVRFDDAVPEPLQRFASVVGHPVFAAIANRRVPAELFLRLLQATPLQDIEAAYRNASGHTALGFAILLRNGPRAEELLRFHAALAAKPCYHSPAGAETARRAEQSLLPLLFSVQKGCTAVFNRCCATAQAAEIAAGGHALLLAACARGLTNIVEKIVSCGGDVHATRVVDGLLAGAGPQREQHEFTTVMLAAAGGHDALATSLAANWHVSVAPSATAGATAGVTTALHCAIWGGCETLVSWLLQNVPHLALIPDVDGVTPIQLSQSLGRIAITRKIHRLLAAQAAGGDAAAAATIAFESTSTVGWFRNAMSIAHRMLSVTAAAVARGGVAASPEYDTFIAGGGSLRDERILDCGDDADATATSPTSGSKPKQPEKGTKASVASSSSPKANSSSGSAAFAPAPALLARFAAAGNAVGVRALADFVGVDRCFALHRAAAAGHVDVCRLLLSLGCSNVMSVDGKGRTAFEVAVARGKTAAADYLFAQLVASDGAELFFESRILSVLRSIVEASSSSNSCRGDAASHLVASSGGGGPASVAGASGSAAGMLLLHGNNGGGGFGHEPTIATLISRIAQVAVERGWAAPLHRALTAKTESFRSFSPLETALLLGCPECVMRILAAQHLAASSLAGGGGAGAPPSSSATSATSQQQQLGGRTSPSSVVVLSDPALALVTSPMTCIKPSSRVLLFDVFGVHEAASREVDAVQHLSRLCFADVRLIGINTLFTDEYLRSCVEGIFTVNHEATIFEELIYEPIGPLPRTVTVYVDFFKSSPSAPSDAAAAPFVSVSPLAARSVASTLGVARFRDSQLVDSQLFPPKSKRRVNQRQHLLHAATSGARRGASPHRHSLETNLYAAVIKVEFVDSAADVVCCASPTEGSAVIVDRLCFHDAGRLLCLTGRIAALDDSVQWAAEGVAAVRSVEEALSQECTDAWRTRFAKHPLLAHGGIDVIIGSNAFSNFGTGAQQLDRCEAALKEVVAILRRVLFDDGDFSVLDTMNSEKALGEAVVQYKGTVEHLARAPPRLTIRLGDDGDDESDDDAAAQQLTWFIDAPSSSARGGGGGSAFTAGAPDALAGFAPRIRDCRAWLRDVADLVKVQCCIAAYRRAVHALSATAERCGFEFQQALELPVAPAGAFRAVPTRQVAAHVPSPHVMSGCVIEACHAMAEVLAEQHDQLAQLQQHSVPRTRPGSRSASAAPALSVMTPSPTRRSVSAASKILTAVDGADGANTEAAAAARLPTSLRKVKISVLTEAAVLAAPSTAPGAAPAPLLLAWSPEAGALTVGCTKQLHPTRAEIVPLVRARLDEERLQRTVKHVATAAAILKDRVATLFPGSVCHVDVDSLMQPAAVTGDAALLASALAETYSSAAAVTAGTPISALGDALARARAAPFGQDLVRNVRSISIAFYDSEFLKVRRLRRFDGGEADASSSPAATTHLRFFVPTRCTSRSGGTTASRAFDSIQTANDWYEELLVAASTAIDMNRFVVQQQHADPAASPRMSAAPSRSASGATIQSSTAAVPAAAADTPAGAVARRFEPLRSWLSLHSAARAHSGYVDVQLLPRDPFGNPIALPTAGGPGALDDPVIAALFDAPNRCRVLWYAADDEIVPAKVLKAVPLVVQPPAAALSAKKKHGGGGKKKTKKGQETQQHQADATAATAAAADRLLLRIEVPQRLSISGNSFATVGFKLVVLGDEQLLQMQAGAADDAALAHSTDSYYVLGRVPGAAVGSAAASRLAEWRWSFDGFNTCVAGTEAELVLHWLPQTRAHQQLPSRFQRMRRVHGGDLRRNWAAAHPTLLIAADDSVEGNPAGLSLLAPPSPPPPVASAPAAAEEASDDGSVSGGAAAAAAPTRTTITCGVVPAAHTRVKLVVPPLRNANASVERMRVALNITLVPDSRAAAKEPSALFGGVDRADAATTFVVRFDVNVWSDGLYGDWQRACNVEISDQLWRCIAQRPEELEKVVSSNEARALAVFSRRANGQSDLLAPIFPANYYSRGKPRVAPRTPADLAVRVALPGSREAAKSRGGSGNAASARRDKRRRELLAREEESERAAAAAAAAETDNKKPATPTTAHGA